MTSKLVEAQHPELCHMAGIEFGDIPIIFSVFYHVLLILNITQNPQVQMTYQGQRLEINFQLNF